MQTNQQQNPNDRFDTFSSVSTHKSSSEPVYHQNKLIKCSLDDVQGLKLYLSPAGKPWSIKIFVLKRLLP